MPITELRYDGTLDIATANTRKAASWKNKEILWSTLVEKLVNTTYTHETHAEYMAAKKLRQDEIKDVGGFVGGHLTGGRRKASSVLHRQLITLDLDFAIPGFWTDFELMYNNAAVVYSTHKHTVDNPRLRLIMPVDRPVRPDEYEAISRRIAGVLGIEMFDTSTFQPERLMYWPSTSKDAVFEKHLQDGPWLCADEILATYIDWTDSSGWPVSVKVSALVQRAMTKQGDPLEKTGVVGAFCRTYNIHEAIEAFLQDEYEACDIENRYTYKRGSTAAGLVVYDDKYAYSHHGTDPTGGKLCNAFDLVRLHKYGLKDEDAKEDTPGNKLPSYIAMLDFAKADSRIKVALVNEKMTEAKGDFEAVNIDEPRTEEAADDSWKEKMEADRKGNIYSTINNIVLVLENDSYLKGRIAYDDFEKCEVAVKDLPWRKVNQQNRRLTDKDDANIRHYLESTYGISSATKVKDAMQVIANKTAFHPVRDYISDQEWDGIKRIDTLMVDYMGAEDTEYTRTVTRKALVAAVARVFQPGVKFDNIIVLVGEQGKKKSSLIDKLGRQWYSDSFTTIKTKESFEQLQGVWLVEIPELAGFSKAEVEAVKHYVSKRQDRYRVAFGHRTENFPRQCIFFGTTNKKDFLKDPTGDRRYWPINVHVQRPTKQVFVDLTEYEIGQVWAEAMELYRKGETLYLPESIEKAAKEMQLKHTEEHPWVGMITEYLDKKIPVKWPRMNHFERLNFLADEVEKDEDNGENADEQLMLRGRVCVAEIWAEGLRKREAIDDRSANAIRNIMRNLEGWEEQNKPAKYSNYGTQRRGYFRTLNSLGKEAQNSGYKAVTKPSYV